MTAVIYNQNTGNVVRRFDTIEDARRALHRSGHADDPDYVAADRESYEKYGAPVASEKVTVLHPRTDESFEILREDVGTVLDPTSDIYIN